MFKIISINPSGLFSYGIHKTIQLDKQGSVLLEGVNLDRNGNSNGSGKSSLFHAICHILFGENPSGCGADKVINEFLGKYFGQLVLLDKNGAKWRITDARKWRKTDKYPDEKLSGDDGGPSEMHNSGLRLSGTDVYLERWNENIWIDERSSNRGVGDVRLDLKATRKKILDIIDMDYEQFMSVAYLAQQQTLRFIGGAHKERMQVIAELSDLKAWDTRIVKIREDISTAESELSRLESKLDGLGQITFTKPNSQDQTLLQSSIDSLDLQMSNCDIKLTSISILQKNWDADKYAIKLDVTEVINNIRATDQNLLKTQTMLDTLYGTYSQDCDLIRQEPRPYAIVQYETEIAELNGQTIARRFDLEQLMVGAGKCSRCRTNVTIEHILRHRELINMELTSLAERIQSNKNKLEIIVKDCETDVLLKLDLRAKKNSDDVAPLLELMKVYRQDIADCNARLGLLQKKDDVLGTRPDSIQYGVEQQRLALLAQKSSKELELKNWEASAKRYDDYNTVVSLTQDKIHAAEYEVKHMRVLERLFGDKGIKAFKLDNVLSILNQSLDKYIDIISDGSVKVWVSQYREKADGELASDLQIVVREGHKHEVPFALYSGGERQQITLAFIGAFWQLASQCGAGVNIMCLDEIFGPLDEYNTGNVFNYLDYMRTNGKSSIFIVTHNDHIKHQVKFDQIWTVTKHNHMSTLDTK